MSFESDAPRGPRPVVQRRRRGALAPTLAILGVLVVVLLALASVWTDVLWYQQLDYVSVFRTEVVTQALLFVAGGLVMAGAVLASLMLAYRGRPVYAPVAGDQASLDRYRETIEPLRRLVAIAVPVALGLFAASAASQEWQTFLLWWNRVPFGTNDSQFGLDIGFFVFTLPWLTFLTGFLTAVVFLAGLAAAVTHYLYGGLRLQGGGPRMTAVARIHLSSLAAAFLLLRAVDYWLGRYELSTKQSRLITGLTYTDANATLTARGVLAGIATVVAVLFIVAAVADRWRLLPLYGVVLLVVSAILIGGIYPAIVQRFQVTPNQAQLETPYIQRNIDATRAAYGLAQVKQSLYPPNTDATPAVLRKDAASTSGIRLLDPAIVSETFKQTEQGKQYYTFPDPLDVDRYSINGISRDTVIAVRELNLEGVPAGQRNWVNDHLVYTHGYGVVAAYGNAATPDGKPSFFQGGIPTAGALGSYEPRIYFGEQSTDYSIVGGPAGAQSKELDYPDDTSQGGQKTTTYAGNGGVSIGSAFNRLLFALKFREQNILLSGGVTDESRIMYDRKPADRVAKVAPYLTLDGDPYPAVVGGRLLWIVDGYTTSDRYPYSTLRPLDEATSDSLTASSSSVAALPGQQVNYIRNSVKATVDAFDGSVTLYAWDDTDPVLKAWGNVFPGTLKPVSQMSADLMSHVRYPEDLFKVQRSLLTRYHVTDGASFFNGQDFWQVPPDPTVPAAAGAPLQPPYYLSIQMPDDNAQRFSLTTTFIPPQGGRSILTGFLAVDSDAGATAGSKRAGYGTFRLLQLPQENSVPGPGQVQNIFNSNSQVNTQLNILRGGASGASTVKSGNLLTLPLAGGLLYVQPVYVEGRGQTQYPLLQKVLVAYGERIGFADTLSQALDQLFSATPGSGTGGTGTTGTASPSPSVTGTSPPPSTTASPGTAQARLAVALDEALQAITDGDAALKAGDLVSYARAQDRLKVAVQRAAAAQAELGVTASSSTLSPKPTAASTTTPSP